LRAHCARRTARPRPAPEDAARRAIPAAHPPRNQRASQFGLCRPGRSAPPPWPAHRAPS